MKTEGFRLPATLGSIALAIVMLFQLSAFARAQKVHPDDCAGIACRDGGICADYAEPGCTVCGNINESGVGTCTSATP